MARTTPARLTAAAAAAGLIALSLTGACGATPSPSTEPNSPPATVTGGAVSWGTPPGCTSRSCETDRVYRLVIAEADGIKHSITVDAAVYKACLPGELFPDCAQNADAAP
jgi:hypothetical protein